MRIACKPLIPSVLDCEGRPVKHNSSEHSSEFASDFLIEWDKNPVRRCLAQGRKASYVSWR